MCPSVDDAVDGDELGDHLVARDVLVQREKEIEAPASQLGQRQAQHGEQDKHARQVQALAWKRC